MNMRLIMNYRSQLSIDCNLYCMVCTSRSAVLPLCTLPYFISDSVLTPVSDKISSLPLSTLHRLRAALCTLSLIAFL